MTVVHAKNLCKRVLAKEPRTTDDPNKITCKTCRSNEARKDPRTRLHSGDAVIVGGHRRIIGRFLTRGESGFDYSRTSYLLRRPLRVPREGYTWEWVDWQDIKFSGQPALSRSKSCHICQRCDGHGTIDADGDPEGVFNCDDCAGVGYLI